MTTLYTSTVGMRFLDIIFRGKFYVTFWEEDAGEECKRS